MLRLKYKRKRRKKPESKHKKQQDGTISTCPQRWNEAYDEWATTTRERLWLYIYFIYLLIVCVWQKPAWNVATGSKNPKSFQGIWCCHLSAYGFIHLKMFANIHLVFFVTTFNVHRIYLFALVMLVAQPGTFLVKTMRDIQCETKCSNIYWWTRCFHSLHSLLLTICTTLY